MTEKIRVAPTRFVVVEEPLVVTARSPSAIDRAEHAHCNPFAKHDQLAPSADAVVAGRSVLREGQRGESIAELQELLELHFPQDPPLAIDGRFGPKTEAAVRAFQAAEGLAVDGVVGVETLGRLEALTERDLLLDPKFTRLDVRVQYAALARLEQIAPDARRDVIRMLRSEPFHALAPAAQENVIEWKPLEGRVTLEV